MKNLQNELHIFLFFAMIKVIVNKGVLKLDLSVKAAKIVNLLENEYPDAICALQYTKDYELLFATRLSAQCTDVRVNIVTKVLFQELPSLEAFAQAPIEQIESLIKTCGLYHTKAKDLKNCAIMLLEQYDGKVPDSMTELLKLPGIGRKTANLILGDIYHKPAIVTDTHCIRLANRIGLVHQIKDPKKVEMALKEIIQPEKQSDFCHRLVLHGREVCTARKPYCEKCCLASYCDFFHPQV